MSIAEVAPDELYFAVLDAPVSRGRAREAELSYAFEASLPVDLNVIHARYIPLLDGCVLAVGIDRSRGAELAAQHHAAIPTAWPDWVHQELPPPASVNLLTGDLEPHAVKTARSRLTMRMAVVVAVTSLAISLGLERRIQMDAHSEARLRSESLGAVRSALGESAARTSQPMNAVLVSELRRLRATRGGPDDLRGNEVGADEALAQLLSAWPAGTAPKTESITVAERSIELTIVVPDPQEAQHFLTALTGIDGLALATTSSRQESGGTRLTIRLDRGVTP